MTNYLFADYLVLVAGGVFVLAYLIINQIILRCTMLIGTTLYGWYYSVVAEEPLWTAICTSIAMATANIWGLAFLLFRKSHFSIPSEFRDLYGRFDVLPPGDFGSLARLGSRRRLVAPVQATLEHEPVETLFYVVEGTVIIEKSGESFTLQGGIFLGEVAFLTGTPASATARIGAGSEIIEWSVERLRRKSETNVRLKLAVDAAISHDLARKVARAGAPIPAQRGEIRETASA